MYEAKERVFVGWGAWGDGGAGVVVEFKWLLAPQVSHPGVLQRWEGSSRGSSLVLVLSVLLLCNWPAGVSAQLGCFLLGQEPEGWKDAKFLSVGPGPYLLGVDYTDCIDHANCDHGAFQQILFFFFLRDVYISGGLEFVITVKYCKMPLLIGQLNL